MEFDFDSERRYGEMTVAEGVRVIFAPLDGPAAFATKWEDHLLEKTLALPREERLPDDFYTSLGDREDIIFVDTEWWNCSEKHKREFVLYHELAHVELRHFDKAEKLAADNSWSIDETRDQQYCPGGWGWVNEREANEHARVRLGWSKQMLWMYIYTTCCGIQEEELLKGLF